MKIVEDTDTFKFTMLDVGQSQLFADRHINAGWPSKKTFA